MNKTNKELFIKLTDVFIYCIYNYSIYESRNKFKELPTKLFLHYDWKELFKDEVNLNIKKIIKLNKKLKYFPIQLKSIYNLYIENDTPIIKHCNYTPLKYSDIFDKLNENSFEKLVYGSYINIDTNIYKFIKEYTQFINTNLNLDLIHFLEYYLHKKNIELNENFFNNFELYSSKLKKDLKKDLKEINIHIKIFSLILYNLFLLNRIKTNKLDLKELEQPYIEPFYILESKFYNSTPINSYKWDIKKQDDLKTIFNNLKPHLKNTTYKQFKDVFDNKNIEDIKPINTNLSLAQIIYFEELLIQNNFIKKSDVINLRLSKCFLTKDKVINIKSITSMRSSIKNEDFEKSNKTLSIKSRKKIEDIFKNL